MSYLQSYLSFFLSLFLLQGAASAQVEGLPAAIPIELDADGHILVKARLNGQGPFTFVLDSGGGGSHMVSAAVAKEAAIRLGKVTTGHTGAGSIEMRDGGHQTLSFANGTNHRGKFFVEQYAFGQPPIEGTPDLAGTIGTPLFDDYVVELDFENRLMLLHEPKHWKKPQAVKELRLRFGWFSNVPRVSVRINDQKLRLLLDTGAFAAAILPARLSDKLGLARVRENGELTTGAEQLVIIDAIARRIEWADEIFRNVPLVAVETPNRNFNGDGVIGMGMLACRHLWISYSHKRLYLGKPHANNTCTMTQSIAVN